MSPAASVERYWRKTRTYFESFETVVLHASLPGVWKAMAPLARVLDENRRTVLKLLEGWCSEHMAASLDGKKLLDWRELDYLARQRSCLFVTGDTGDVRNGGAQREWCRQRGIRILFVFDGWKDLGRLFPRPSSGAPLLPDRFAVVDEKMRKEVLGILSGDASDEETESQVEVYGAPAIEESSQRIQGVDEIRKRKLSALLNPMERPCKLFLMQPLAHDFRKVNGVDIGYDEHDALAMFMERFVKSSDRILVMPHPRQDMDEFHQSLERYREVIPVPMHHAVEDIIALADEVYGMTSTALIAAVRAGKIVYSLQPNRTCNGKKLSPSELEERLAH